MQHHSGKTRNDCVFRSKWEALKGMQNNVTPQVERDSTRMEEDHKLNIYIYIYLYFRTFMFVQPHNGKKTVPKEITKVFLYGAVYLLHSNIFGEFHASLSRVF